MKKIFKNTLSVRIMSLVLCFMLFIYEQVLTFSQNVNDYWFNLKDLLINNIILFIIIFIFLELLNIVVYLISNKFNKEIIYNIYKILFFIAFVVTYIQGNYLVGSLPVLDGSPIIWSNYTKQSVISILLVLVVSSISVILYKKYKEYINKVFSYTSLAIFAMLFVSFITIFFTNSEMYAEKGTYVATNDNINTISSNKNLLVFLIDMADSKTFAKVLKDNDKEDLLTDFTYFPDTLSAYPFTRESIPLILTGEWYEAKEDFNTFFNNAMTNSSFIKLLKENDFEVNIYENELYWNDDKALEVSNIKNVSQKVEKVSFYKQELKYILYKYLMFPLKKYSRIETMDYNNCRSDDRKNNGSVIYSSDNKTVYDILNDVDIQKENYFQFVHIDGGHYPWDTNKDFETIENGTYEEKLESAITVLEKYLDRIKDSGMYDNSAIIILADHGNNGYDPVGRQNPILYIKGFNEKHELEYSDKKVSYTDLNDSIYEDIINGKKSSELLSDVKNDRVRRFLYYKDYGKMREQLLDGHAWETDKLKDTGKKYER